MPVLSEIATMTEVAQGTSLARFGDGELQIIGGKDAKYQKYSDRLAGELEFVFNGANCLVGVPHARGIRAKYWEKFLRGQYWHISQRAQWYGSAFVSRHDEVAWTEEYRRVVQRLWKDRLVVLVAPEIIELHEATVVMPILCPKRNAFAAIDRLETDLLIEFQHLSCDSRPLVVLSCGPTATVLADRLARKGIWAVDLGNFGKFL